MWHLGTWFNGGLGAAGLVAGLGGFRLDLVLLDLVVLEVFSNYVVL